jgi:hypothetical protein
MSKLKNSISSNAKNNDGLFFFTSFSVVNILISEEDTLMSFDKEPLKSRY